ncbi:HSP70 family protein, putative [Rhizoctonia solani AG-3 Rhs1AP]|uniref:HSP70 family protein, putative n=2 Tax=Rhizoctonia solani AG-3 TaxID=1086053 RepID=A0A0A1UKH0_9AGAM|nr:HSP70 family protein, putative [Rhizoctonia solani AG-3 Rhs1AP]KEP46639.1 putative glucose regulated stress protein, HSP70-like protein [Rhizoctonia solani 123E]
MIPLVALLALCSPALASILAVDYGADTMKVALMKPGVPFDVVLDRDSKRKIASVVGWKGEDRLFGQDGRNLATRFPSDTFSGLKPVQGVLFDSGASSYYTTATQIAFGHTSRNTFAGKRPNGDEYSVEELVAMQLDYVRELASSVAGENVRDVVVTVPGYFTQFQRQAVIDATEVAGMKLITLVNDGTAIAVNYAMTRQFPTREVHMIYDSGAAATRATLVAFHTTTIPAAKKSAKPENVTQITVLGSGFDTLASGTELTRRVQSLLESKVPSSLKSGLIDRSYAKLAREAERVKAILSVNVEVNAGVEGLVGDNDFKAKLERKEFDKVTEDLFWRFQQPMLDAIDGTGVGLADVESVILHGGTTRVPFVQTVLKSTVGSAKLATNVNADEACVLGTAFYGASLSRQFRTKPFKVQDAVVREVYLSYTAENKGKDGNPRTINTMVFPVRSATGLKKTLTLKRKQDFDVVVGFNEIEPAGQPGANVPTLQYIITGVEAAYNNLTERGATDAAVKLTLLYSESGLASITEAAVVGTVKDDSLTGKLKNFFGGGSSSTSATESSTASASEETKVEDEPKEPVEKIESIPVTVTLEPMTVKPMSLDEKKAARKRLIALNAAASTKREHEEAFNNLEGFLYRLRRLLSDDSDESPFNGFSTPEERAKIEAAVDAAMEWLNETGSHATAKELWAKRDEIEAMEKPIQHRYKEAETGPQALKDLQQAMFAAKLFVSSAQENRTKIEAFNALVESNPETEPEPLVPMPEFTEKEIQDVQAMMDENEAYLNERVDVQKNLPKHADPVLVTAEMNSRGMKLQSTVQRLTKRKPKVKAVKKPQTTTSSSSSSAKAEETTKEKVKDEL